MGGTDETEKTPIMIGTCEPFKIGENFEEYIAFFENYLDMNSIEDEKRKIQLLMNLIGREPSAKISKACLPKKPIEYTYKQIKEQCLKAFLGDKNTMYEHYKFNKRDQRQGEKLYDFAIELQSMADDCKFGDFRTTALRDRFVAGMLDQDIKARVLSLGSDATFKAVLDEALKLEMVSRDAKSMDASGSVQKVFHGRGRSRQRGKSGKRNWHGRSQSQQNRSRSARGGSFRDNLKCFNCHGTGHFAKQCPSGKRKNESGGSENGGKKSVQGRLNVKHLESENVAQLNAFSFGGEASRINVVAATTSKVEENNEMDFEESLLNDESPLKEVYKEFENKINNLNVYSVLDSRAKTNKSEYVDLNINNRSVIMEIDTGAIVTICTLASYKSHFSNVKIEPMTDFPLNAANGVNIEIKGVIKVDVEFKGSKFNLPIVIMEGEKPLLLIGRNWLDVLYRSWRNTFRINSIQDTVSKFLSEIKVKYNNVFKKEISEPVKEFKAEIVLQDGAIPIVHKAYNIPFSQKEKAEKEYDRLEREGVWEKIKDADWGAPTVIVPKSDGSIRVCGNYAVTVNPYIRTDHYPIPVIDEVLAEVGGHKYYSVLDMKGAYQQLELTDKSKRLLVVSTHKGLYMPKRMPFGVKPASQIFQSVMDKVLEGIRNTKSFIDDVVSGADTIEELMDIVREILDRLLKYGFKVNWDKCHWFATSVVYLGHKISHAGIEPNPEKVKAISEAPVPKNATQVKSFIGLVNYYAKFVPELSIMLKPFYELTKQSVKWEWTENCEKTFQKIKKALVDARILVHYDPKKPMVVVCDASDDGISAILCHVIDGVERPVFYASRVISKAEKNYPILHREALAIVFGLEKFYKYIFGYKIKVFSDHKPLLGIFNNKNYLKSGVVASRLQRYINRVAQFDFEVFYRVGSKNLDADCLSRLPLKTESSTLDKLEEAMMIKSVTSGGEMTLNIEMIRKFTEEDLELNRLREIVRKGWPKSGVPKDLKKYFSLNESLSVENDVLVYEERVIVPNCLKDKLLKILHSNHSGVVRMKELARRYVFWIGINKDIENYVKSCESCQRGQKDKKNKVYGKWPEVSYPFERAHIDFFFFHGRYFLIFVDVYTRWVDIKPMRNLTANCLIDKLEDIYGYFGYNKQLVSDNGPPYCSYEFNKYCESKGIELIHTPPYHPASNGMAERAVQSVKTVLKKLVFDSERSNCSFNLDKSIKDYLKKVRNLSTTDENWIPSHRLLSYHPRWEMDALKIDKKLKSCLAKNADQEKIQKRVTFDTTQKNERPRQKRKKKKQQVKDSVVEFKKGDKVWYIGTLQGKLYRYEAMIVQKLTTHVYKIQMGQSIRTAHLNQLQKRIVRRQFSSDLVFDRIEDEPVEGSSLRKKSYAEVVREIEQSNSPDLRRSERTRKPPERYAYKKF